MNTTTKTQFEVTNAVGTPEQIAQMIEEAIAMARVTGSVGWTIWVHDSSNTSDITPTVTVKKIQN